ncbi:MAG: hypothetical protein QW774_01340 [Candidatus Micrarchaeaceae archaeon]
MQEGKVIIVDTSSMIFGIRNGIDIFDVLMSNFPGYKIIISKGILRELDGFSKSTRQISKYARLVLARISSSGITVDSDSGYADSWILRIAPEYSAIVCTNDIALKRKLEANGVKVLSISRKGLLR